MNIEIFVIFQNETSSNRDSVIKINQARRKILQSPNRDRDIERLKPVLTVKLKRSKKACHHAAAYITSMKNLVDSTDENHSKETVHEKETNKHYTRDEIQNSILIYFSSPKTYKLLRKKNMMERIPSIRTIHRHIQGLRIQTFARLTNKN